ncbi:MAG: hypothetical protein KAU50_05195, partial [Candidatus Marinimicrobia bacterium]|nr:hypothetical protein [Candidatus Neomarinimicrobiota bacterium]
MSRLQVISKICVLLLMVTAGWGQVVPPASLVTIPTAGTLQRGEYEIEVLMETGGGVLGQLAIGVSDQFMLGMSYGVSEFIGSSKPSLNRITPEAQIKYRLIEEDFNRPAIALGLDTQGYGRFQEEEFSDTVFSTEVGVSDQITTTTYERYEIKAIGAYVVASKNWQVMGNLGSHLGICKNVWEADESD